MDEMITVETEEQYYERLQLEMYRSFRAFYAAPGDDDFEEYFGKEIADLYRMDFAGEQEEGAE